MNGKYNPSLVSRAKELRSNMTKEERHLWYDFLRAQPQRFMRQKVIGHYILDFYCAAAKLAVELDGSQHYEEQGAEYDARRTEYLNSIGITVLRYSNADINLRFEAVCEDILEHLNTVVSS